MQLHALRMLSWTVQLQAIHKVSPLAAYGSLDEGDVLEFNPYHGQASFKIMLNLRPVCMRQGNKSHAQRAWPFLNDLDIADLVPKDTLFIAEYIPEKRPRFPRVIQEDLLHPTDDRVHAGEAIGITFLARSNSEITGVISDELCTDTVERGGYDALKISGVGWKELHVTIRGEEVEAVALPTVIGERRVFAVSVPVRDPNTKVFLKSCQFSRAECLGPRKDSSNGKRTEEIFAY